jgi:hypothetical protein
LRDVPNVLHAPLYPILMAALLFVVRSPELAGIAISVLSGTLLIVFVYRFTVAVSGAQIAIVAAILAALCYIVIDTLFADKPYLPHWIAQGIPDPCAKRVFDAQHDGGSIDVYRWTGNG